MTHVFDRVRGARKAPEDLVLKRMKNLWEPCQPDMTTSQLLHGHKIRTLLGFVWPRKPGIGHSCACRVQFGFVKITWNC